MRARFKTNSHFEEPSVNLTPLIDVVFVILIMFIVVAPLLQYENIELVAAAPQEFSKSKGVTSGSLITIRVEADNKITLNGHCVSCEALTQLLIQMHAQHPAAVPQLFHDQKAQFGTYHKVKNAVESAGFASLDLIMTP